MVTIRLTRHGAKNRPFYHIIVTDNRFACNGRFIECIGFFNPIASGQEKKLSINFDRVTYWVRCGAVPSKRVSSLIKKIDKLT